MSFHEEDYPETDDGFGPGSDLVLSVLGIVVLLIAISRVYAMFDLQLVSAPPDVPPAAAVVAEAPQDQQARIAKLSSDLEAAREEAERYKRQLVALPKNVVAFTMSGQDISFFSQSSAELRPAARDMIRGSRLSIGRVVLESGANLLQVVGYASPEPPADRDLSLSSERAVAVMRYLSQMGIPENCLSVVAVGRGRSELLYDTYLKRDQANTVQGWDALFALNKGAEFGAKIETMLSAERKVEIVAVGDVNAKCTNAQLRRALGV